MRPCKNLDYESEFVDCTIKNCAPRFPDVRYWEREERWTRGGYPQKVQFCKERGRINAIFPCYDGSMGCYEPVESAVSATEDGGES